MSTHDALETEPATLQGDVRSVTEPTGAVESARVATTWRQRRFPGVDKPPRLSRPAKRNRKTSANGDAGTMLRSQPFRADDEAFVQNRPTLGGMPRAHRIRGWWLLPVLDFAFTTIAAAVVLGISEAAAFPALPLAPILYVATASSLGIYRGDAEGRSHPDQRDHVVSRLLIGALFAWSVGLLSAISEGDQILLWGLGVTLVFIARAFAIGVLRRVDRPERWVIIGDALIVDRLRGFKPLEPFAEVVGGVEPSDDPQPAKPSSALAIVERFDADRVVISSKHKDDNDLLDLVCAFKSIGTPVSLMPRPLDLLEAPSIKPRHFGGVPLIEIDALAARQSGPYKGPCRRLDRGTRVSVVVPAMNEEGNIGDVLRQLPGDLHEVVLVDGNSKDETVAVAEAAYPGIKVVRQSGKGKGDALRSGFAEVTGNIVVMVDADGSADPAEIPRFVAALEAGADFAKGSRYLNGGGSDDITWLRKTGNTILSGAANLLHGTEFTDLCYGYNAFWTRCLPFISLDSPGFEVETLINLRIASADMKITEVPSYELCRVYGSSNLNTFRDGFRVLRTIVLETHRKRSMRTSTPAAYHAAELQPAETANF